MPTNASSPSLTNKLYSLARDQLQMQTSRSGTLDTSALGVMAVDTALATVILSTRTTPLWIAGLGLLGLSLGFAAGVLSLPKVEETGPFVPDMLDARETQDDQEIEEWLFKDLIDDLRANRRTLARKAPLFNTALILLMLSVIIDIVGRL
jgi:hypothetical protein